MSMCMFRVDIKRFLKADLGCGQITFRTKNNTHFKIGFRRIWDELCGKLIATDCTIKIFNFKAHSTDNTQSFRRLRVLLCKFPRCFKDLRIKTLIVKLDQPLQLGFWWFLIFEP